MKYHIEKNTIQETLVIPLYARALCTRRFPPSVFRSAVCGTVGAAGLRLLRLGADVRQSDADLLCIQRSVH